MLKILVVDDELNRFDFFTEKVFGSLAEARDVRMCTNSSDAIGAMQKEKFDVLIVDMAILPNAWSKAQDPTGGIALLRFLNEDDSLKRPAYIIGLTAGEEKDDVIGSYFSNSPWVLLRIASGVDWQSRLVQLLEHACQVQVSEAEVNYGVDVCIVSALSEPEQQAVFDAGFEVNQDPEFIDSCTVVRRGSLNIEGGAVSIVFACSMRMGSVEAAILVSKIIHKLRPRIVIMAGICAGTSGKVEFGDPILATSVWDWTSSKWTTDDNGVEEILYSPNYISCSPEIDSRYRLLMDDANFFDQLRRSWRGTTPATVLTARRGPMASGPIVVADGTTLESIKKKQNRDVLGLEMEAYGVYYAVESAGTPRPLIASIKAVCDFADPRKNDEMQKYAAFTSARTIAELLRRFGKELCAIAR